MTRRKTMLGTLLGAGLLTLLAVPERASAQRAITEQEAHDIGVQAYLYFYSLVTVDITRGVATNVEPGKIPGFGPANTFNSFAAFPTTEFKSVVRPNFDTLYSSAFLDMTKEPMVVSAPDTRSSRSSAIRVYPQLPGWTLPQLVNRAVGAR